jgi:hypothetical protein
LAVVLGGSSSDGGVADDDIADDDAAGVADANVAVASLRALAVLISEGPASARKSLLERLAWAIIESVLRVR